MLATWSSTTGQTAQGLNSNALAIATTMTSNGQNTQLVTPIGGGSGSVLPQSLMQALETSNALSEQAKTGVPDAANTTTTNTAPTNAAPTDTSPRVSNFDESGNAIVPVKAGETLQSLAQAAYGDSKYWYLIAEANGLTGTSEIRVGQSLIIPTKMATGTHTVNGGMTLARTSRPTTPASRRTVRSGM